MSGRLILVRHGETEANVAHRLDTRVPGAPLTELGNRQAREAGERLATAPPLALISSVALRARQTAAQIETATGVSAEALDGIFEVQVGDLEDRSDKDSHEMFKQIYHRWHQGDLRARVPGGESGADVLDRFLPVIADLRGKYLGTESDGAVLMVSHAAAIRLVAAQLAPMPGEFAVNNHLGNTETVELIVGPDGRWTCVRWGRFTPPFAPDISPVPDNPIG